jgi:N-carbamoylputrescine amidase
MKDIRIAVVICNSPVNRVGNNLDRMTGWIEKAKDRGAEIICFPEMNITGYRVNIDMAESLESIPGHITDFLLTTASRENIVILAGMAEKDKSSRIFATHLVAEPEGNLGIYRKLYIAPPENPVYTAGNEIPLFETRGVKFGIQLCYDAHFPELSSYMAVNGADIIFIPHASPRGTPEKKFKSWMRHLTARAYDNSIFVVACNQTGANGEGLTFPGISIIIDPLGNIIKKNITGKEGIMIVDLRADDLRRVRDNRMSFFLPNKRTDLYR